MMRTRTAPPAMMCAMNDPSRAHDTGDAPLTTREGERGRSVFTLESPPLPQGPLMVEVELLDGTEVSVSSLNRLGLADESLVSGRTTGIAGRSLVFARPGRAPRLRVKADGRWVVRVLGPEAARPLGAEAAGTGDEVLSWAGAPGNVMVTYLGDDSADTDWGSLLAVWFAPAGAVRRKDADLLLLDSEARSHLVRLPGPGLLVVQSDGRWTVSTR